jgi:hypothetical protein
MNSVENLKSAQWRHLFRIFKFSSMQSFNIFVARKGFLFEFANLSGVRKFENYLTGPGPHVSDPFLFDRPGWSPGPTCCPYSRWRAHHVESAWCRWPPVVAAPRGLAPPYHCSGHHRGSRHPLCFSPPTIQSRSSLLYSAPATASPAIARRR